MYSPGVYEQMDSNGPSKAVSQGCVGSCKRSQAKLLLTMEILRDFMTETKIYWWYSIYQFMQDFYHQQQGCMQGSLEYLWYGPYCVLM